MVGWGLFRCVCACVCVVHVGGDDNDDATKVMRREKERNEQVTAS